MRKLTCILGAMLVLAVPASARVAYEPTVVATPATVAPGGSFGLSGCGYRADYGPVVLAFHGQGQTVEVDENGCVAAEGYVAPGVPGVYDVYAIQKTKGNLWREVAENWLTVAVE